MQENNKNELERFEKERHDDFLGMLRGFIVNQVSLSSSIAASNVYSESIVPRSMLLFFPLSNAFYGAFDLFQYVQLIL